MNCPTCGKAMEYFGGIGNLQPKAYVCHACKIKTTNCNVQHIGFFEKRSLEGYAVIDPPTDPVPLGEGLTVVGGTISPISVSLSGVASSEEFNALVARVERLELAILKGDGE